MSSAVSVELCPSQKSAVPAEEQELVFDRRVFLARVDGDRKFARDLVELFLEDQIEMMATIASAVRTGDAVELRLAAHSLRGTVANFSAPTALKIAHRLEEMGRTGDLKDAPAVYAALVEAIGRLRFTLVEFATEVE